MNLKNLSENEKDIASVSEMIIKISNFLKTNIFFNSIDIFFN